MIHNTKKKHINYTAEDFYNFGQKGMSKAEIAKHYDIAVTGIYQQFKKKPELDKAYQAGLTGESLNGVEDAIPEVVTDELIPLSYAEIERAVLAAIDAHCCTISQIKFHAKFHRMTDFFSVIEGMLVDKKM